MVTESASPQKAEDVGEFFSGAWTAYKKCLEANILRHREFFSLLGKELNSRIPPGGVVMDLACGDASNIVGVLPEGIHYLGVDLAKPALDLASHKLKSVGIMHQLVQEEFQSFVKNYPDEACIDGVLISYSLHHLDSASKGKLFVDILRILKPGGTLWVIDGIRQYGDTRDRWLERLWNLMSCEGEGHLSPAEMNGLKEHIWKSDFPESCPGYAAMALQAGFEMWEFLLEEGKGALGMFRALKRKAKGQSDQVCAASNKTNA